MTQIRSLILALVLSAGLAPAFAQAPPPVPALPDTERRTSYVISGSVCSCAVGFQIYQDSTDVANWLKVYLNGVEIPQSGNWTITSPSGSIATLPRPITNAVLTFTTAQTGTVQIVGAQRPRRLSEYAENRGVAARDLNQAINGIEAQLREMWDRQFRTVQAPPGETLALLPVLASRANLGACFDGNGNLTSCTSIPAGTFTAGAGISFTGTNPTTIAANLLAGNGIAITGTSQLTITNNIQAGSGVALAGSNPLVISSAPAQDSTTWRTAIVNDTILNTDCLKTIQLGTGSTGQFSETLPGVGGFPTGCEVTVKNGDTAAGKKLIGFPSGILFSNILYPNQAVTVKIVNGTWIIKNAPGRYRQSGVQLYASNTGSNSNDCLALTTPCLSIATAVLRLYQDIDNQNGTPQINVACGLYNESVNIQGPVGYASVFFIVGASATPHCVQWRNATAAGSFSLQIGDYATVEIQNVWFDCSGCTGTNFAIALHQHAILDILSGVEFGEFGTGYHIQSDGFSKINMPCSYAISGSAGFHVDIGPQAYLFQPSCAGTGVITITNTPTFSAFYRLNGNATIILTAGLTYSGAIAAGAQKWAATGSSYIDTGGLTIPGSVAGAPAVSATPYGGVAK